MSLLAMACYGLSAPTLFANPLLPAERGEDEVDFSNSVEELRSPEKHAKRARSCVRFKQALGEDEVSVDLSLTNRCKVAQVCALEWRVSCDGTESELIKKSRELEAGESWAHNASAKSCSGDWQIQDLSWRCASPTPD